jgi:hypothetical protein
MESQSDDIAKYDDYIDDLNSRINVLLKYIKIDVSYDSQVSLEMVGLMGSAYKRLAEMNYYKGKHIGTISSELKAEQKRCLEESLKWYKKASITNLSHHWSLVQFISLHYILNGEVLEKFVTAAEIATDYAIKENANEIWAYGSKIELGLLMNQSGDQLKVTLDKFIEQANNVDPSDKYPFRSTHLQLMRYKEWWIQENGFFGLPQNSSLEELISQIELTF